MTFENLMVDQYVDPGMADEPGTGQGNSHES